MNEGNERNLESVAPEAVENMQEQVSEPAAAPEAEPAAEAQAAPDLDDRENAPASREPKPKNKKKKKKKSKRRSVIVPLAIVLAVVLVLFGVLVGYGLSLVRSERRPVDQADAQEDIFSSGLDGIGELPAYNAFDEEMTGENQQALDALAGEIGFFDDSLSALLGEDALFAADVLDGELGGFMEPAGEPVVVAEFGDGQQLMSDEVLEAYSNQLSMYILSGYSEAEVAETLLDEVLHSMVSDRVLAERARELGLYDVSDADRAEIKAEAEAIYNEYLSYYRDSVVSTEGMSEEEIEGAAKAYLADYEGVTYDSVYADIEENWWQQKLYAYVTDSVTVDDAAVQAAYDARLAEQKQDFEEYPDDYEFSQMNGETILYNLPGYRAVKMLLLGFENEDTSVRIYELAEELSALDGDALNQRLSEHQAELDAFYAGPEARAEAALEQLQNGADMDELILSVGTDAGMMDERQRAMGYYVSADSMLWPATFIDAAMGLENVGDCSAPVRTDEGVCILQYLGDVPEGAVPLADVREELAQETLDAAQYEAYAAQVQAWLEEANPSYYPERMQ